MDTSHHLPSQKGHEEGVEEGRGGHRALLATSADMAQELASKEQEGNCTEDQMPAAPCSKRSKAAKA